MSRAARLLLLAAVLVATAVAVSHMDPEAMRRSLETMSWRWAGAAAAINLLGIVIDASRWRIILSATNRVSLRSACHAQLVGIVGNVLFPFKLGEGARAYVMATREGIPPATSLTTVLLDRVVDAVVLPLFLIIASLVLPLPPSVLRFRKWMLLALAAAIAVGLVGSWWIRRQGRRHVINADEFRGGRTIDRIISGVAVLGHHRRMATTIAVALLSWLARCAIIWCMLNAFHLPLPVAAAVSTLMIINLGIAVVATPGNVGTFELATAGALALWAVPRETGLSLGIAMHALEVIPALVLGAGAIFFVGRDTSGRTGRDVAV